ncbi:MAG TPA: HWE histidine kinase domain-containing protein [Caulobacteraceae bacterium]|jgi:PAS domain S-box-containing protein|nr:HWE histidine kinase domain-containing protein [Caulobacteraceae bacterium]
MADVSDISKRWRTAPMAAVALALGLLLAGLAMGVYNERLVDGQKTAEVSTQAHILASSVSGALAFDDRNAAQEYVSALRANPDVEAAGVFDLKGRMVAGFSRAGTPLPRADPTGAPRVEGARLVVRAPVAQGATRLGSVYLRTITEPLVRRLARYSGIALLVVMASLLVAVLGASNASLVAAQRRLRTEMIERAKVEGALLHSQKMEAAAQLAMETERGQAALRQSEQQLEFALEAGRLGSWQIDLKTRRLAASEIFHANFGGGPNAHLEHYEELLARVHPGDRGGHQQAVAQAVAKATDLDSEFRTFAPDGDVRWFLMRGRAVYDSDGLATRMAGVSLDITDRKRAEERQQLLLDELNHRVKNTLATVQSIAGQSRRWASGTSAFEVSFLARINALARAHDLLTEVAWEGATLREVIANTIAPYVDDEQIERFSLSGPAVRLGPNAAVSFTMAFHELATNAAKYGSLSVAAGRVEVEWRIDAGNVVDLQWCEIDGPTVTAPTRRGFGARLVETGLPREFGGEAKLSFEADGVRCRMRVPISGKVQLVA